MVITEQKLVFERNLDMAVKLVYVYHLTLVQTPGNNAMTETLHRIAGKRQNSVVVVPSTYDRTTNLLYYHFLESIVTSPWWYKVKDQKSFVGSELSININCVHVVGGPNTAPPSKIAPPLSHQNTPGVDATVRKCRERWSCSGGSRASVRIELGTLAKQMSQRWKWWKNGP